MPIQDFPDDWTQDLAPSTIDTISWSFELCGNIRDPRNSYVAIATPLKLTGVTILPVGYGITDGDPYTVTATNGAGDRVPVN